MKLHMKHRGIKSNIVCSNGDPELTLTYFTARSNFVSGKCDNDGFFGNYCKLLNEKMSYK